MSEEVKRSQKTDNTFSRRGFILRTTLVGAGALAAAAALSTGGEAQAAEPAEAPVYPRSIVHVGVTVPDINAGINWYMKVFGWTRLMDPAESVAGEGYMGKLAADLYGPKFKKNKMAMLSTGNGCDVEFFEYVEPESKKFLQQHDPWTPGWWHICVMDPDIEGMVTRIVAAGGKQISKIWETAPGTGLPFKICYTQDPWGNHIEISSRSAEFMMGPR